MRTKKMEFSKKILIVVGIITVAIIVFSCVMMVRTGDLSPLQVLIPSVFAEVATGTGFYYWKARLENSIKLKKSSDAGVMPDDFAVDSNIGDGLQF